MGGGWGVVLTGERNLSDSSVPPPQASKYCSDAKDYLEMMCKDLSEELSQFDLRKETELKQVMLDYAAAQLEKHEKVCG